MQLKRVRVRSLFERFDHDVPINLDEKITIITAPNGYGKTVLLNLITYFLTKQFHRMMRYDFKTIEFTFEEDKVIKIHRTGEMNLFGEEGNYRQLRFEPVNISDDANVWDYRLDPEKMQRSIYTLERRVPFLERIGRDEWIDERTGNTYSTFETFERFSKYLPEKSWKMDRIPEWLNEVVRSTECHLIETQRLLRIDSDPDYPHQRTPRRSQSVVERNAEDLSKHIAEALQNYANQSQKLDQSFPKRVLQYLSQSAPPEESIRDRLGSLEIRRKQLVSAGLLDKSFSQQISAADLISDENIRNILDVYVSDTEEKLNVFENIYEKINLFLEIMMAHFLFKKITVGSKNGILINDDSGNNIPLNDLSSGEQHELVLIYDLIFKVSENALILIDEPELSLHVGWQKRFISDIERIQNLRPLTVIIATHSPQIIGDRWDLVVDLSGS